MNEARLVLLVGALIATAIAVAYLLAGDCDGPKINIGTVLKVAGC